MKRMTWVNLAGWVAVGLAGIACAARAETNTPVKAELKIGHVALFKNGLGCFVANGTLPEKATTIRLGQFPVPAYGTFWVGFPDGVKVQRLVTSVEETDDRQPAQSVGQLLQLNVGARAVLRTGPGEKDVVEGVIRRTVAQEPAPGRPGPNPYAMDVRADPSGRSAYPQQDANLVLVETAGGLVALNAGSIVRADFGTTQVVDSVAAALKRPGIRLELEKPAPGAALSVSYLARGITWCPGYRIDLADDEQAALTAQALVINEVADLEHVSLDLVTGFPNMKFGEVLSPVAMSQSLADFLAALAAGRTTPGSGGRYGGQMYQQQAISPNAAVFDGFEGAAVPSYSTAQEGTVAEDLFLYPVKDFSLRRGETAYLPLFTARMPYRHLYTWKVEDSLDKEDRYRQDPGRSDGKAAEEVWHSCRLRNTLKMPLTTAAAEFANGNQFVGQDLCYYTAPGAETTIRINRAMNVLAEQAEYEMERKRNATSFYGYSFDLVKVRGELKLRNRMDKVAAVEVTKELSGEVLENPSPARDVITAKGLKQVNPRHVLTWEIPLKPGAEQTLTYVYQVYIRN